ncbi:YciI family protein [Aliarcobacter butzleri]|uniref:YciI family protein n=1 Tax=Aliarcobacter butzleri TaxID=28197 RepID=UPI0021B54CFC|nr:YciI family protein [Aliarcobacter butzleri]MCT7570397.1 YciI family protein [Aliarcobacter butzleri]MCT7575790.1 YciI family protein [Aliarcobacter butzleri]MCT7579854.1 YciI family protein [Aliarcobacter butzleri]
MQYLVIAYDNDGALERRLESREAHIEGARKLMSEGKIIDAGALIEDDMMVGSTLFVDFENDEEIDEWLLNEPYVKNNVWNMDEFQMVPMKLLPKN